MENIDEKKQQEFLSTNRWLLQFPERLNISSWRLVEMDFPKMSLDNNNFLKCDPIKITFNNWVDEKLFNTEQWLDEHGRSIVDLKLELLNSNGVTVKTFKLIACKLIGIEYPKKLNYKIEEILLTTITILPQRIEINE